MPLIQLSKIEKILGDRMIFDQLAFHIDKGERVGLIGANGAGKTTLFKTIVQEMIPDAGEVTIQRGIRIGYLKQDSTFDPANTILDEAELAFQDLHDIAHKMRDVEHAMAHETGDALDKTLKIYEELTHDFEEKGGYAWHHRLESTLLGVGLEREIWDTNVEKLSGGQRSRLALAKILISEPDVLLLDEPTNHLDLEAIDWLEEYLLSFPGAVLIISHDRYLLDRLATRVVWLTQQKINSYPGNYSAFVIQRDLHELSQQRAYEEQQKDIEKQKEFIRRFGAGQRAKEAKGREKRLDRLLKSDQIISSVQSQRGININLSTDQRAGDQVLRVKELTKSFGERLIWQDLEFNVKRGERIGVIGPNGSGKTTLLKVLLGQIDATRGDIKWGSNLNIAYYDQRLDEFDPENTILEEVHGDATTPEKKIRDLLGTLLFSGDDADKKMGTLSGGERARVAFAKLIMEQPNVIMLDEPTNHLDIRSAEALEQTIKNFDGTILCVSHDRFFLEKTVERLIILDPPGLIDFAGTIHDWQEKKHAILKKLSEAKSAPKKEQPKPKVELVVKKNTDKPRKDNPYNRKYGKLSATELDTEISKTEQAIRKGNEQFADPNLARDQARYKKLQNDLTQLSTKLADLEQEYYQRDG